MALNNLLNLYREVKWQNEECVRIMRLKNDPWRSDAPSYDRTWSEIEAVLEAAISEMKSQRAKYKLRKISGPREAKYRALMKFQRAKGIVDTLRWTLGVRGQASPLDEGLGD